MDVNDVAALTLLGRIKANWVTENMLPLLNFMVPAACLPSPWLYCLWAAEMGSAFCRPSVRASSWSLGESHPFPAVYYCDLLELETRVQLPQTGSCQPYHPPLFQPFSVPSGGEKFSGKPRSGGGGEWEETKIMRINDYVCLCSPEDDEWILPPSPYAVPCGHPGLSKHDVWITCLVK